jgi:DNA-binding transcriptional ArsR family regulator
MAATSRPDSGDAPTPAQLEVGAGTFDMLSTPVRLHLMWLLCHGEHDVGWLAAAVNATVAAVSQHLAKLRLAGLVSARRHGRHQIYQVHDPHIAMLIELVFEHLEPDGSALVDRADRSAPRRRPLTSPGR